MLEVLDVVADGEGWSLTKERGQLVLTVKEMPFIARSNKRSSVSVTLPPGFVREFLRQKRPIRDATNTEK